MPLINNVGMTPADPADYVVEQEIHTSSAFGASYRKWHSGVLECWGGKEVTSTPAAMAWGPSGWYRTTAFDLGTYPESFKLSPNVQFTFSSGAIVNGGGIPITTGVRSGCTTLTAPPQIAIAQPTDSDSVAGGLFYYAIGRWK